MNHTFSPISFQIIYKYYITSIVRKAIPSVPMFDQDKKHRGYLPTDILISQTFSNEPLSFASVDAVQVAQEIIDRNKTASFIVIFW